MPIPYALTPTLPNLARPGQRAGAGSGVQQRVVRAHNGDLAVPQGSRGGRAENHDRVDSLRTGEYVR